MLGFQISDPVQNPDPLQPNLALTIQNPDKSGFQILTVFRSGFMTRITDFSELYSDPNPGAGKNLVISSYLKPGCIILPRANNDCVERSSSWVRSKCDVIVRIVVLTNEISAH